MNPAISAATMITTAAAAQAAAKRKQLTDRLDALPRAEATRARVLEGHPELEPALDQLIAMKQVRVRADGTLRHDVETLRARSAAQAKVGLLVVVSLLALGASVAVLALVLP